jgi:hypothetical protein
MRIGSSFIKIGRAVLYPVGELDRWNKFNLRFADPPDLCRWRNTLRSVDPNRHSWLFKSQAMRYDETYDAKSVIRRDVGISSKILHDQELFITTSHAPHIPINDPC